MLKVYLKELTTSMSANSTRVSSLTSEEFISVFTDYSFR